MNAVSRRMKRTTLLNGEVKLIQPDQGFRTGIDSVLLAAFCPAKDGEYVLDIGCGVGAVGLCVHHRVPKIADLKGLEIDEFYTELAAQNYRNNGCVGTHVKQQDIRRRLASMENGFDQVVCNPPFLEENTHQRADDPSRARAMGQGSGDASLEDWVKAALFYLKPKGCLTMVQRADMLDMMLKLLKGPFGAIEVLPLYPKPSSKEAKRVLIRAYKSRKSPMVLHAPLIVHEEDGAYTDDLEAVLRRARALPRKNIKGG